LDVGEKIEEVFLAPVGAMLGGTATRIVERDGWYQVISPGSPFGNEVVLSRIDPARVDAVVRDVIREYAAHGVPFKWSVGPLTEPADLGDVLARYGFIGLDVRGMAIEPSAWNHAPVDGVVVEPVTRANLVDYIEGFTEGWSSETAFTDPNLADDVARTLDGDRFSFFVAKVGAAVAGTAGYAAALGYLIGGNVLPRFRGTGVYRALLDTRLRRLAAVGCPLATTQAREATSAPILEHLGFESVFRFRVYRLDDPRAALA
jgi:GNAT superfamily N-acetyltransferase